MFQTRSNQKKNNDASFHQNSCVELTAGSQERLAYGNKSSDERAQKENFAASSQIPHEQLGTSSSVRDDTIVISEKTSQGTPSMAPEWLSYSQDVLANTWLDSTNALGVTVSSSATAFGAIRTESPDQFVVLFPTSSTLQRDYCENAKLEIAANLEKKLQSAVSLVLQTDPSISPYERSRANGKSYQPVQETHGSNGLSARGQNSNSFVANNQKDFSGNAANGHDGQAPRVDINEIRRQFEQNEVVQEIKELFEAELGEIKMPAPKVQKTGFPYL